MPSLVAGCLVHYLLKLILFVKVTEVSSLTSRVRKAQKVDTFIVCASLDVGCSIALDYQILQNPIQNIIVGRNS